MPLVPLVLVLALLVPLGACSFLGDVFHAEGQYSQKIGDAFKRQAARRQAAHAPVKPRKTVRPASR